MNTKAFRFHLCCPHTKKKAASSFDPIAKVRIGSMSDSSKPIEILSTYLHLAAAHGRHRFMADRDRFLVISAVIAQKMKLYRLAAYCRHLVLENNPGHMFRRWTTVKLALEDDEFLLFLKQIQRRFPQERAETLLVKMNIVQGNERATYFTDEEYAAALLGIQVDWLHANFDDAGPIDDD
jgi:hypothetical protein